MLLCFHGKSTQESFQPLSIGRYQRIERGLSFGLVKDGVPLYNQESFSSPSFFPFRSSGRKRKSTPSNWSSFLAGWCFSLPFTSLVSKVRFFIDFLYFFGMLLCKQGRALGLVRIKGPNREKADLEIAEKGIFYRYVKVQSRSASDNNRNDCHWTV